VFKDCIFTEELPKPVLRNTCSSVKNKKKDDGERNGAPAEFNLLRTISNLGSLLNKGVGM
jgi:hypothetical protein